MAFVALSRPRGWSRAGGTLAAGQLVHTSAQPDAATNGTRPALVSGQILEAPT